MIDRYRCYCGGPLVPMRVGINDCTGKLESTICFKQGCRNCGNSRLTDHSEIMFYSIKDNGEFNFDVMQFVVPEDIPYHSKKAFIECVLALVEPHSYRASWIFSRDEIRDEYRRRVGK